MEIIAKKISKGSLFKIYFIGISITITFFIILVTILGYFGLAEGASFNLNGQIVKGWLASVLVWLMFISILPTLAWLATIFGLWVYSLFKPIRIRYIGVEQIQPTQQNAEKSQWVK